MTEEKASGSRTREKSKIALEEYVQGNELVRHYDAIDWVVGSIFIPLSLGLLGLSLTEPVLESDPWSSIVLCITSLFIYGIWLCLDSRYSFYSQIVFHRLHELERKCGMDLHFRIHQVDSARRFRRIWRVRFWIRMFVIPLIIAWVIRVLLGLNYLA